MTRFRFLNKADCHRIVELLWYLRKTADMAPVLPRSPCDGLRLEYLAMYVGLDVRAFVREGVMGDALDGEGSVLALPAHVLTGRPVAVVSVTELSRYNGINWDVEERPTPREDVVKTFGALTDHIHREIHERLTIPGLPTPSDSQLVLLSPEDIQGARAVWVPKWFELAATVARCFGHHALARIAAEGTASRELRLGLDSLHRLGGLDAVRDQLVALRLIDPTGPTWIEEGRRF